MKRFMLVLVSVLLFTTMLSGCGSAGAKGDSKEIEVMMVDGAPLLTMAKMYSEDFAIKNGYDVSYTRVLSAESLTTSLMNEQPDFAIAPINIAAMVNAYGSGYRMAAVTIWGIMHIASSDDISSFDQLIGEVVFAFSKSGTPGITLRRLLDQNDILHKEYTGTIDANRVNIAYLESAASVRNAMILGELDGITVKHGLLAEPVATAITGATSGKYSAKINLQDEWAEQNNGQSYPQAALIFHERLLEKDADFVNKFISMTEWSALYAMQNPKSAGELAVALGSTAIPNGIVVENAMNAGRLSLDFTRAQDAKEAVNAYLEVLLADEPTIIGGSMPSDSFFYSA